PIPCAAYIRTSLEAAHGKPHAPQLIKGIDAGKSGTNDNRINSSSCHDDRPSFICWIRAPQNASGREARECRVRQFHQLGAWNRYRRQPCQAIAAMPPAIGRTDTTDSPKTMGRQSRLRAGMAGSRRSGKTRHRSPIGQRSTVELAGVDRIDSPRASALFGWCSRFEPQCWELDMDLGLKGKRVLITGASQGIGRGLAEVFAEEGCALHLTARQT